MRKITISAITITIICLSLVAYGQQIKGRWAKKKEAKWEAIHMQEDTLYNIGGLAVLIIKTGDTITFGNPRNEMPRFSYIYYTSGINGIVNTGLNHLSKYSSGEREFVNGFSVINSANNIIMHSLECGPGIEVSNFSIRTIEQAIESGEVSAINSIRFVKTQSPGKVETTNDTDNTINELSKLKKLLDSGAITQQEYDKLKGKIINGDER